MNQQKEKILKESMDARAQDIMQYQINIDNYKLAIEEIEKNHCGNGSLAAFSKQLKDLLQSSIREQDKEKIMFTVIQRQLENQPCTH